MRFKKLIASGLLFSGIILSAQTNVPLEGCVASDPDPAKGQRPMSGIPGTPLSRDLIREVWRGEHFSAKLWIWISYNHLPPMPSRLETLPDFKYSSKVTLCNEHGNILQLSTPVRFMLTHDGTPRPYCLSANIPDSAPPGLYRGELKVSDSHALSFPIRLTVLPHTLPPPERRFFQLHLNVNADSPPLLNLMNERFKPFQEAGQTSFQIDFCRAESPVRWRKKPDGLLEADFTLFDERVRTLPQAGAETLFCNGLFTGDKFCFFTADSGLRTETLAPGSAKRDARVSDMLKQLAPRLKDLNVVFPVDAQNDSFRQAITAKLKTTLPRAKLLILSDTVASLENLSTGQPEKRFLKISGLPQSPMAVEQTVFRAFASGLDGLYDAGNVSDEPFGYSEHVERLECLERLRRSVQSVEKCRILLNQTARQPTPETLAAAAELRNALDKIHCSGTQPEHLANALNRVKGALSRLGRILAPQGQP